MSYLLVDFKGLLVDEMSITPLEVVHHYWKVCIREVGALASLARGTSEASSSTTVVPAFHFLLLKKVESK